MTDAIHQLKEALSDRYEIQREIGRGGMSYVYLATDLKHGRRVALKILRPELRMVVEAKRFLEEIRVTANLSHSNILPLFDSGDIDGVPYFVMPYVAGETLKDRLEREGRLPVEEAIFIATEVANALEFAHRNGVVHRDVKPGNILIQAGRPLIGDFGIALGLAEEHGDRVTGQGLMVGTPEYMSPEQAHADPDLDGRSDVYSLGAVLYEMLAGKPPFLGRDPFEVLTKAIKVKPRSLRKTRDSVPESVDRAVLRSLAKSPEDRYQSANELASTLKRELSASAPALKVVGGGKKSGWLPTALGAGVMLLLALLVAFLMPETDEAPRFVAGQTYRLSNAPGLELDPAISPSGDMVAFATGSLGAMKIYVRQLGADGEVRELTDSITGHHRWPRWSPDGSKIAFLNTESNTSSVQIVPVAGGASKTVVSVDDIGGGLYGASWSPDGCFIAYGTMGGIYTVSAVGGPPTHLVDMIGGHSPSWSPDGSRIVFVTGNPTFIFGTFVLGNIAPSALWTVPAQGGAPVQLTETTFLHMSPVWTPDGESLLFVSNHDGRRDVYQVPVDREGNISGERVRLTTGLNAHTISLAGDASRIAYSVLRMDANVWSLDIPARGTATTASAVPVTRGSQAIEGLAVSPDGNWLAYDSDMQGTQDIYRLHLDEGSPERLTTDPRDDFYPSWTRDGSSLAFYSFRTGKRDVWTMDADGANEAQVTSHDGHNRAPQWSPDGNSIVYHSDLTGRSELYLVSRATAGADWGPPRRLTDDGAFDPQWSPNGRDIAYIAAGSIRVIRADGGEPRTLVEAPENPDEVVPWKLAWSPGGSPLYFKAFDAARKSSFWSVPASGGVPRLLAAFDDPDFQSRRNEFATDGNRFFFTIGRHESDIWLMDLDGADANSETLGQGR